MATNFVLAVLLLQGCAFFAGKPALPRHASLEAATKPAAEENFDALIAEADVVYFPTEAAVFGARSEPSARLLEAFKRSGARLTIAWDLIDTDQQPLLDELENADDQHRDELIARLELEGNGRAREHCRAVLRMRTDPPIRHVALRSAAGVGASSRHMAAAEIVRQYQASGGGKLLVFAAADELTNEGGIPFYVAQKVSVRQVVLESEAMAKRRAKLLTDAGRARSGF